MRRVRQAGDLAAGGGLVARRRRARHTRRGAGWAAGAIPLLFGLLLLALAGGCATGGGASAERGTPGADFSAVTLDGRQVSREGYGGKPLILAFWASW